MCEIGSHVRHSPKTLAGMLCFIRLNGLVAMGAAGVGLRNSCMREWSKGWSHKGIENHFPTPTTTPPLTIAFIR